MALHPVFPPNIPTKCFLCRIISLKKCSVECIPFIARLMAYDSCRSIYLVLIQRLIIGLVFLYFGSQMDYPLIN